MTTARVVARVVSGGQTGVDRAALEAARVTGTPYGGWCPRGGLAEDHSEPPGVLTVWPELRETPGDDPAERTSLNVSDSDAVLVLRLDPDASSPGTELTVEVARRLSRPCLQASAQDGATKHLASWLADVQDRLGRPPVLDVAGPRESEDPGVESAALRTLLRVLRPPSG